MFDDALRRGRIEGTGRAQGERQRARGVGQRDLLGVDRLHFDGHHTGDDRIGLLLVGDLVDGENADILDQDVGRGILAVAGVAGIKHVDAITRQHEAADAHHVVDADRHGAQALAHDGGERGPGVGSGNLPFQDRFVRPDGRERHPALGGQFGDGRIGAIGDRALGPGDFAELLGDQRFTEGEIDRGHHDGDGFRRRRRYRRGQPVLAGQPDIGQKHRDHAEHDGDQQHDESVGAHLVTGTFIVN